MTAPVLEGRPRPWRRLAMAAIAVLVALPVPAGAQVDDDRPRRSRSGSEPAPSDPSPPTTSGRTPTTITGSAGNVPDSSPTPTSPPRTAPATTAPPRPPASPVRPTPPVASPVPEPEPEPDVASQSPVARQRTTTASARQPSPVQRAAVPRPVPVLPDELQQPPQELPPVEPDDPCDINRSGEEAVYNGTDPSRQLAAYSPFRVVKYPCPRAPGSRAMVIAPGQIEMIEEGRLVRRLPYARSGAPMAFERIARAVGDPAWIAEVEPGVFEVATAIVQEAGTSVLFAAPGVTTIRLLDRPDVFLGGRGATARFEGVTVTSWSTERGAPDEELADGRPFVLYDFGGRLDIVDSQMSYLGSDRSGGAYGVSWRQDGITGEVLGSTFDHNLFGVFTYEAADIVFRGNVFRDNIGYGFDPHDFSTRLVVEDNEAYGNGNHGFIVSRFVVDSVIRNNHSHDNKGSGVVLDFESNRNRVENNLIEDNGGDGVVVLGSGDNLVANNVIRRNRAGVRVNNLASVGNSISGNHIEGNYFGIQAYGGASDLDILDNTIIDTTETGMVLDAPRTVVRYDEIRGAARGVDIRTTTQLAGTRISEVERGVTVTSTGIARLDHVDVNASVQALRVDPGGLVTVESSSMVPPISDLGSSDKDPWLPLVGVGAVLVAVMLELVRWQRERRDLPSPIPAEVWNRA